MWIPNVPMVSFSSAYEIGKQGFNHGAMMDSKNEEDANTLPTFTRYYLSFSHRFFASNSAFYSASIMYVHYVSQK